ncbi:YegP family protein [[Eubacterium] cellulosolvens]
MPAKFEVYKDASGQFRFRLRAANNEIIAVSEAYTAKASCMNGIESVKTNAPIAEIEDQTNE